MWTYITNILKNSKLFYSLFDNPNEVISLIKERWSESQRHYHGVKHLYNLIKISQEDKWVVISCFHDIVYNPKKNNNEEESIKLFKSLLKNDVTTWRK
jgi:predicted metal-dependent HD superfamily phosphohydrolase